MSVAQKAPAQTRTVVVHDGPNTILTPGETCAGNEAVSLGITNGWARVSGGTGIAEFASATAFPAIGTPPAGGGAGRLVSAAPGDTAMFTFGNPLASGLPFSAFASLLVKISYSHSIVTASGGAAGPAPVAAVFLDLCGDHLIGPGADDILIYQPAAQSSPCLAGATSDFQECTIVTNTTSGELISAAGTLPPGFLLSDYLTATAGACDGAGPQLPAAPNPLLALMPGEDGSEGAIDDTALKITLPLLSPVGSAPADELRFDFEADCAAHGGDVDGDCLCDAGFPNVVNADQCPGDATNSDSDGDGVCDIRDNCFGTPNPDQADSDGDQIGNACDNCPLNFGFDQTDDDDDGIGNICDACPIDNPNNPDGDGVCTSVDNCPNDANANQQDVDGDDIGDVCDADDGAGLALQKVELLRNYPNRDRWAVKGELDASATPNFLTEVDGAGLTASVARSDGTIVESETWSGTDCVRVTGGTSIRCKNATGGTIRFNKTRVANVFKMTGTVVKQTFATTLPTIAQTPLQVTLTTPVSVDRLATAGNCIPRSNFKKVLCINP